MMNHTCCIGRYSLEFEPAIIKVRQDLLNHSLACYFADCCVWRMRFIGSDVDFVPLQIAARLCNTHAVVSLIRCKGSTKTTQLSRGFLKKPRQFQKNNNDNDQEGNSTEERIAESRGTENEALQWGQHTKHLNECVQHSFRIAPFNNNSKGSYMHHVESIL